MEEVYTYKIRAIVLEDKVVKFYNDENMVDKSNSYIIGESEDEFAYLNYQTIDETGAYLWKIEDGKLTSRTDAEKEQDRKRSQAYSLREMRKRECFSIINRGQLWYNRLTDAQKAELDVWYNAWLDVTETLVVPDKPTWLEEV